MSELDRVEEQPKRPWWVLWVAGGLVAVIVTLVVVLSTRHTPPPTAVGDPADSASSTYEQTWERPYAQTTCSDCSGVMTQQQKLAAAADILTSAWVKIEKSSRFPPDSLIRQFQEGITTSCVVDTYTITDVTYLLYQSETIFQP